MQIEVELWRRLARATSLQDAAEDLVPLLHDALGADLVLVRRLDVEARRLETVAIGARAGGTPQVPGRTALDEADLALVTGWIRRGELLRDEIEAHRDLLALLAPAVQEGRRVAGPLQGQEDPLGAVVLAGRLRPLTEPRRLLEPFAAALETYERMRELTRLRDAMEADRSALLGRLQRDDISEAIVGSDAGLKEVLHRVGQVARTEAPVLLIGETGSGKEVIARAIHKGSPRATGPMLKVNCGAIPPGLVDSELFGHERGSFTGAQDRHRGWFERADGGTLFLDEVGELPLAAQVRLLRVLQDGSLLRVGGQQPVRVDVRIVAATHRRLDEMVRAGTFREDLWYRIGVFPILLPPLRERCEDIPELAAHFAWRAGKRLGGHPLNPSPEDIQRLLAYPWPGNVRELAAVIERAAILGDGKRLEIAAALGGFGPGPAAPRSAPAPTAPSEGIATLDGAMIEHLERALTATRGRIEGPDGAAAMLGINPHTLRSRMRKLGLDWQRFRKGRG
jgi:transcriptional regulator with GAF, ATPase, and Fis domain